MYTTRQVAVMAGCSSKTVERAIDSGDLAAEKVGAAWAITDETQARAWAAAYVPYAALRKAASEDSGDGSTAGAVTPPLPA